MDESNKVPVDIAETLVEYLPDERQVTAYIGSKIGPTERHSVHLIGCNQGRDVVWNDHAGGSVGSAYECGYDGSEEAADFIKQAVDGYSPDDGDSIPVEFEGDEEMTEEITSHLSLSEDEHVETNL